jgi:hypothetical protein
VCSVAIAATAELRLPLCRPARPSITSRSLPDVPQSPIAADNERLYSPGAKTFCRGRKLKMDLLPAQA